MLDALLRCCHPAAKLSAGEIISPSPRDGNKGGVLDGNLGSNMKQRRAYVLVGWCWLVAGSLACAGAPRIVFDYSCDSNGFFTPERRVLLERAAAELTSRMTTTTWAPVDPTAAGGHYELAVINPSTMAVSWVSNAVIPANQITVRVGATDFTKSPFAMMNDSTGDGASQLLSVRNISGPMTNLLANSAAFRPVDASITFDLQGILGFSASITRQWYFPTNPDLNLDDRNPADPHYDDYSDFYDTAVHELGHVLGIHNPLVYQAYLACDPQFCAAWTSRVQSDGQGGYVFTGAHARQFYYNHVGSNIPLDTGTRCHWADGVRSGPSGGWPSLSYESNRPYLRVPFSELEFAALQDLGYVITPVPQASITSLTLGNGMLTGRFSGLIPYLQCYLEVNEDLAAADGWESVQTLVPTGGVATVSGPAPQDADQLFIRLRR